MPDEPTGTPVPASTPDEATPPVAPEPASAATPPVPPEPASVPDLPPLDWRSGLPPDLQRDPTLQQYKSLTDAAKGLVETKKLVGNSIRLPTEDAPEAWGEVWNKLGRPESPSAYTDPEADALGLPEGFALDAESVRQLREGAHAEGFTQKQYEATLRLHAQWLKGVMNQADAARAEAHMGGEAELAKRYGASAPRLKQAAQALFSQVGNGVWGGEAGERAYEAIVEAGLDNNIDVVTAFANMFERMGEGRFHVASSYGVDMKTTAELNADIKQLMDKEQAGGLSTDENTLLDQLFEQKARMRDAERHTAGAF